ncbi:MAG TPA: aspartate phosphatase [Gammaproteobacteria bacterium]|nr:aspartate phosphatase [Gammaproteobacteria bacterium]
MLDRHKFIPVINARLGRLLGAVFLLFALLVVNSVYLAAISLLEQLGGEVHQNYFYLLMFLLHLALGLLITLPVIVFALAHMRRAWRRPNRYAVRAGMGLFFTALVLLISGLLLTRFDFFEINDPQVRRIGYWLHVISPFVLVWLFVLHRLAGRPIRWKNGLRWSLAATGFAAAMVVLQAMFLTDRTAGKTVQFSPSLAIVQGSDVIPPEHLMTDDTCAECHPDIAKTHEQSMHRFSSFNNPAYKFSVEETRRVVLQRDGTVQAARFCAACHDQVPLFSGQFDDPDYDTEHNPTGQAGITCMTCHAITRVNGVHGNGDFTIVDPPRYPFAFSESALLRSINAQLIKAKPAFHRKTLLKPLHRTAEFCSTCHKANLPAEVNHYRWLRGQDHYDSFLQSGVSGHRVDSFYYPAKAVARCSECHMPLTPSDDPAARDFSEAGQRSIHNHQFPAANTGITHLLDLPDWVMQAHQERLSNVTRIDIFAIKEAGRIDGQLHAPLRPSLPELVPGNRYLIEIVIRTTGVGHHLTQGTTDSNELWLDITATADGKLIGRSGDLDEQGAVDPWSYFVNAYVLDQQGKRIDRRNGQDIFVALYNHQIPPGAATVVHYLLDIPVDVQGPVAIEAHLNYRKFDTSYLQHLQGKQFTRNELPITVMASDRLLLPVQGQQDSLAKQQPPLIKPAERWNDYGIGLLRAGDSGSSKGELRQAEQAFHQAEALGESTGALNLARVYFKEGQLEQAASALQRASEQQAPPWTIAWYSALIDRENGHLEIATQTLETLINNRFAAARQRGFDFSYDVRVLNELGRTLYERSRQLRGKQQRELLEQAQVWFDKALQIDPENLAAHYNLGLIHAQLGNPDRATQHRALHEKYRPDDHAVGQAVARHRRENPAADHAASAIAIYDLGRHAHEETRQLARGHVNRP